MVAALDDGGGRNQSDFCFLLQFFDGQSAAVAHGVTNFGQGQTNVVFQRTSVWNVGVNAFFEGQFACAAHIVTLPVASSCRTSPQYSFT